MSLPPKPSGSIKSTSSHSAEPELDNSTAVAVASDGAMIPGTNIDPSEGSGLPATTHNEKGAVPGPPAQIRVLSKFKFWCIFISQCLSILLFAIDQLILASAIPPIVNHFNSLSQVSWLANGYFITLLAFCLLTTQTLTIFPSKHVLLVGIIVFEVGSFICGIAPTMNVLIFGRALAGVGASSLFSSNLVILAEITNIKDRGFYMSLIGVVLIGPLVGGALADHVTWRWCFYINLPVGALAFACLLFFLPSGAPLGQAATYKGYNKSMIMAVLKCDWVGTCIALGWATAFILFTQWGGAEKEWNSAPVIVCIVLSAVLPFVFVAWEAYLGDNGMFPLSLATRRQVLLPSIVSFFLFAIFMADVYYLSLVYQAVYHNSATQAGIKLLPMLATQIAVLIGSSRVIARIGRPLPVLIVGPVLMAVGSGLLYTTTATTSISALMGYSAIIGFGIGTCLQNLLVLTQYELRKTPHLISKGTGVVTFLGFLGRIVGISLAGCIFANKLRKDLAADVPTLAEAAATAVISSADAVYSAVPEALRPAVLNAYMKAMSMVFIVGVPFGVVALIACAFIKNINMKEGFAEEAAKDAAAKKAASDEQSAAEMGDVKGKEEA